MDNEHVDDRKEGSLNKSLKFNLSFFTTFVEERTSVPGPLGPRRTDDNICGQQIWWVGEDHCLFTKKKEDSLVGLECE